jgi:glucosamine-6-phosphate deaminase
MLHIKTHQTHSDICKAAALQIAAAIKAKPNLVLGLATGNTMEPLYNELVRMHAEREVAFSQVQFFNLDEYKDLSTDDLRSFNHYLKTLFLDKIGVRAEQIHLVQGTDFDPKAYEATIREAGGIDIQLVGVGGTGHIGFNEKGSTLDSLTREIELDDRTREDNAGSCGGKKNVPTHAYTQGIGTIMRANQIIMLGNGGHKAQVVHDMLINGDNIEQLPARALMRHQDTTIYLDEPATELLTKEQLMQFGNMTDTQARNFRCKFDPIVIELDEGKRLTLPYNADIFIPGAMEVDKKFDVGNAMHLTALKTMLKNVKSTYMGAHQDDTEIEVPHEIERNLAEQKKHPPEPSSFLSIIATDGAAYTTALKREGKFANITPEGLIEMRKREQRVAAEEGKFAVIQLQYPSASVKGQVSKDKSKEIVNHMKSLYDALPNHQTAYSHAPVDTHETHVAVLTLAAQALRLAEKKPEKLFGMEGWGELGIGDTTFSVDNPELVGQLLRCYESQIAMQKRPYDEIAVARIRGNGFMGDHHAEAKKGGMVIGIVLSRAISVEDPVSLKEIVGEAMQNLKARSLGMLSNFAAPGSIEEASNGKWVGSTGIGAGAISKVSTQR